MLRSLVGSEMCIRDRGTTVAIVSAIRAKNITYKIAKSNSNEIVEKFEVDSEGVITLTGKLDAEVQQTYNITIQAEAGNQTTESNVLVRVVDVNDNRPVFQQPFYFAELSLQKIVATNTQILKVRASDTDVSTLNRNIIYSIHKGSSSGMFSVDGEGVIRNIQPIPYRSQQQFTVVVVATDTGSPKLSSTAVINIRFANADQRSALQENIEVAVITSKALVGSLVTVLKPTDVSSLKVSNYFNESDGEIRLAKALPPVSKVYHLNLRTKLSGPTTQNTSCLLYTSPSPRDS